MLRASSMAMKPLIAICGTTGVGKSRLAVELALALSCGGKVINADAMQVYQGLDILTNKIPVNEQHGIDHALMSFKKPGEQYIVGDWVQDAVREIDKAHDEGKVPIVVGGTSYWIHHLLFPNSLPSRTNWSKDKPPVTTAELLETLQNLPENLRDLYNALPAAPPSAKDSPDEAFALHDLLSRLDQPMASRWHWKDTRKVLRSIEIIKENGRPASKIIIEAHSAAIPMRYTALVLWLYAKPEVLNTRIENRVEQMLAQGLLEEIRSIQSLAQDSLATPDLTLGVFQAIGFKEFYDYVIEGETDEKAYAVAVAEMKQSTRKYAQRQIKWIRNKMLPALRDYTSVEYKKPHKAYLLDATDLTYWEEHVMVKAKEILKAFLEDSGSPDPTSLSETARIMLAVSDRPTNPADILQTRRKRVCTVCTTEPDRPVMLEEGGEWEAHQRAKTHRYMHRKGLNDGSISSRHQQRFMDF